MTSKLVITNTVFVINKENVTELCLIVRTTFRTTTNCGFVHQYVSFFFIHIIVQIILLLYSDVITVTVDT